MAYVLKATDRKGAAVYVAPSGSPKSYVTKAKARRFATIEEARADACGNEIALCVSE